MQKNLLAELHLPELDLKRIQDIVRQNSLRLTCLINENNEYLKKNRGASSDLKVIVGSTGLNFTLPLHKKSIETLKHKFVIKKSPLHRNSFKNGLKRHFHSAETNLALKSNTIDNDKVQDTEIQPLLKKKCQLNSRIPPCESSLLVDNCLLIESNSCSRTLTSGNSPCDEGADVEIVFDNSFKKSLEHDPLFLNQRGSPINGETSDSPTAEGSITSSTENVGQFEAIEKETESDLCVIAEVIGNANEVFSTSNDFQENTKKANYIPLITPKKTNDITKIKGWRRKQFFVEKPTTVEFYSISKGSLALKNKKDLDDSNGYGDLEEEQSNKENAFVSDSLDEFLDQEADLKIGYEIPHLCAEYSIKLTRDEIVSRPNLSEKDMKEVEMRYCRPVLMPNDGTNLDGIQEENCKRIRSPIEEDIQPCKIMKLEGKKKQPIKIAQKQLKKSNPELKTDFVGSESGTGLLKRDELRQSKKNLSTIKLMSKLIGLVVYPGPHMPLHPIVQYHLDKIRSYRTKVEENWANFAVSAVLDNTKKCKRKILPAYCCVKVEKKHTVAAVKDEKVREKKDNKEQIKLKECSVVIEKLDFRTSNSWCMEHNCYNCAQCGLAKPKLKDDQARVPSTKKREKKIKTRIEKEAVIVSPQASFDKKVASLLAKKVRFLKARGDTFKSIDTLKNFLPDRIEFIKLKFVKESFLAGYINIWYLKPVPNARSRAFLTFSQTSPLPNAVNLKSTKFSLNNLPKVITEIVSGENTFDSNEFAILHCDGEIWEIHGCLNVTLGKPDKDVEQIFTSVELPELKKLQEIAFVILNMKAAKWWVLDLSQKFKFIEINFGNFRSVVRRNEIVDTIRSNSFGFMPLMARRYFGNRVLGAYIIKRLLPFVLIGPYYLLESHDMVLKDVSSTVPFEYHGKENVTTNHPLKFFINSVIRNLENSDKTLEELWLYDKMCLDRTSYLEVVTTNSRGLLTNKHSIIDIEHGYSLNSLTNSSSCGVTSGIIKRCDGKDELKTVTVYLYFDIFDLGFVEGELQFDNSVIINHPLDDRTKMKSHKVGDWFISVIRRRIEFIPKDLMVKWFITKHKDDLRDRLPFNKFFLSGAHVLSKNGVFYLLEMSDSKIEKLGLDRREIAKTIEKCEIIKEVTELKNLANLVANPSKKTLSMDEVLTKAIKEIKDLRNIQKSLQRKKMISQKYNSYLITTYLIMVNSLRIRFRQKMNMVESIGKLFAKQNGDLTEFIRKLKVCEAGWKYLKCLERKQINFNKAKKENFMVIIPPNDNLGFENLQLPVSSSQKSSSSNTSVPSKSVVKLNNFHGVIREKDPLNDQLQIAELNCSSNQINSFKITYLKTLKNTVKEPQLENVNSEKINNTELVTQNSQNNFKSKNEGFIRLTASKLPENIKMRWKNLNINKLKAV